MKARIRQPLYRGVLLFATIWILTVAPLGANAAPYAAMVMDMRTGKVLHAENADTRLHPASLTKMMTLYIVFEAVENGEIGLDTLITVSPYAAGEPPSKLGLRPGQKIRLRYLIRAAAVKSANDAATALAEAIEGSEARFARRMTRTAKAMGMTRTTFKNAHGLTESGHLSTARDMTLLGRQLYFDYPEYYNLFSRITANAGGTTVHHTNRKLLRSYQGADGIKTGYTRAAGFNLVASARRGQRRVVATVFGGRSTATRNARVAELLDLGFGASPAQVAESRPKRVAYMGKMDDGTPGGFGRKVRNASAAAVKQSLRPQPRPSAEGETILVAAAQEDIEKALAAAQEAELPEDTVAQGSTSDSINPVARPDDLVNTTADDTGETKQVVARVSTKSERHWGINVGRYPTQYKARQVLLKTALNEISTLDGSLRKVVKQSNGYDANFMGLSRETADLACRRLQARQITCLTIQAGGGA